MRGLVLFFLATLLGTPAYPGDSATAPYDIGLVFEYSEEAREEGVREELELQLLTELRRAGCFRSVNIDSGPADESVASDRLLLRVRVESLFEETSYETSVQQRTQAGAGPLADLAYTSVFRLQVAASLEQPLSGLTLRSKRVRASDAHRPRTHAEDGRYLARNGALVEMARLLRLYVCKGGAKRLSKELAR